MALLRTLRSSNRATSLAKCSKSPAGSCGHPVPCGTCRARVSVIRQGPRGMAFLSFTLSFLGRQLNDKLLPGISKASCQLLLAGTRNGISITVICLVGRSPPSSYGYRFAPTLTVSNTGLALSTSENTLQSGLDFQQMKVSGWP